ncbi:MAG: TetR/AcrR family transcriptional regulator [Polyangiaceae bacterium]
MPKRKPATSRGARTRSKLLRAAEAVFADKGYEHGSIADIAMTAQVALGTFYVYFPDKKAAFIELVEELGSLLRDALSAAIADIDDRLEVEREGLRAFLSFTAEHRGLYRIVRQAEFVDEPTYRRYYSALAEAYAAGLERAMDAEQVRRLDPEALAYCLMGLADFLGMRWVLWEKKGDDLERVLDSAVSFLQYGLAPVGEAPASAPRPKRSASGEKKAPAKKGGKKKGKA